MCVNFLVLSSRAVISQRVLFLPLLLSRTSVAGLSLDDIDYSRYPCEEFQRRWVHTYLSEFEAREVGEEQVSRVCDEVRRLAPLSHFLWAVWALVQYHLSDIHFDFLRWERPTD